MAEQMRDVAAVHEDAVCALGDFLSKALSKGIKTEMHDAHSLGVGLRRQFGAANLIQWHSFDHPELSRATTP
jgi:hypothetical protein